MLNSDAPSTPLRMSEPNLKEIDAVFDNFGATPCLYFDTLLQPHGIDSYQCALNEILAGLTCRVWWSIWGLGVWLQINFITRDAFSVEKTGSSYLTM